MRGSRHFFSHFSGVVISQMLFKNFSPWLFSENRHRVLCYWTGRHGFQQLNFFCLVIKLWMFSRDCQVNETGNFLVCGTFWNCCCECDLWVSLVLGYQDRYAEYDLGRCAYSFLMFMSLDTPEPCLSNHFVLWNFQHHSLCLCSIESVEAWFILLLERFCLWRYPFWRFARFTLAASWLQSTNVFPL